MQIYKYYCGSWLKVSTYIYIHNGACSRVFLNAQIRETNKRQKPFKAITTEGNCAGVVNEAVYLNDLNISGVGFEKYIGGSR